MKFAPMIFMFLLASSSAAGQSLTVDAGLSGGWYDPTHNGEGFLLEILEGDPETALAYWFTYDPDGNPSWIFAEGTINGNVIEFGEALRPVGARFGDAFDPDDVEMEDWGSFSFDFSDCNAAKMDYDGIWGMGSQDLLRLWGIDGVPCSQTVPRSSVLRGNMTGAWYDPLRDGEGFLIDIISEAQATVYWFTFDNDGNQYWIFGVGNIVGGQIIVEESFAPSGGNFGPEFDPSTVELNPWGPMGFTFAANGNESVMAYDAPEDFDDGGLSLDRLTSIADTTPGFSSPPAVVSVIAEVIDNLTVDSDVNDANTPPVPNDDATQAQMVPNPAIINGFATATPTASGNFSDETDEFDAFRVALGAGQQVFLEVADYDGESPAAVDLDLMVFRVSDSSMVASSTTMTNRESVTIPDSDTFDVVVQAVSGSSNYRLSLTAATGASAATAKHASSPTWVPGEAVVSWVSRDQVKSPKEMDNYGVEVKAAAQGGDVLASVSGSHTRELSFQQMVTRYSNAGWTLPETPELLDIYAFKALAQQLGGAHVEPNYILKAHAEPTDPEYAYQWHYPRMQLPQAWDIQTGSTDVVVAVLDTGISVHPDNGANVDYSLGADLISGRLFSLDGDGVDFDAHDPGDQSALFSSSFHGTHVAGTVGAHTNNGEGGAGVAWDVTIMPVRVLGRGGAGSMYDINQGIRWAAGLENDTGTVPDRPADVMNLSLGGPGFSIVQEALINEVFELGIPFIASAGNEDDDVLQYPASYPRAISVAASTILDMRAPYSSFGERVDIAAPGGNNGADVNGDGYGDGVLSNNFRGLEPVDPTYEFFNGTSMAAPHVAGVAALMKAEYPAMTAAEFETALEAGLLTIDVNEDGADVRNDTFGYGRLDALKAVQWAREMAGGGDLPTSVSSRPSIIDFGAVETMSEAEITGNGGAAVDTVSTNQPWLTATASDTGSDGLGTYLIEVNRDGLPPAPYRGTVTFAGPGAQTKIDVNMTVGDTAADGESATIYAVFVDTLTLRAIASTSIPPGTSYPVSQELLPASYVLVVGTDLDNDQMICDEGEMCGAFRLLTDLQSFNVTLEPLDLGTIPIVSPPAVLPADSLGSSPRNSVQSVSNK